MDGLHISQLEGVHAPLARRPSALRRPVRSRFPTIEGSWQPFFQVDCLGKLKGWIYSINAPEIGSNLSENKHQFSKNGRTFSKMSIFFPKVDVHFLKMSVQFQKMSIHFWKMSVQFQKMSVAFFRNGRILSEYERSFSGNPISEIGVHFPGKYASIFEK